METLNITREQVNEAIGKFADVFLNDLGVAIADEEPSEPELTGTQFKAIDINGVERIVDAKIIEAGTLITHGALEHFRVIAGGDIKPWVRYSGEQLTHVDFAEKMRTSDFIPRIIHEG